MKNNRGISLIVLVITIIVIIILVAAVVLQLTGNNPIDRSKVTKLVTSYDNIKTDIELFLNNVKIETKAYFTTEEILSGTGSVRKGVTFPQSDKVGQNEDKTWNASGYKLINNKVKTVVTLSDGTEKTVYELIEEKYVELVNDFPLTPNANSHWYIDIESNPYLVFDSIDDIPKYIRGSAKNNEITDDATLAGFVAIK